MDSVFFLNEGDRSTFLQTMMQAFGSTYIILWSYESNQPFNCLQYKDGFCQQIIGSDQPSSSSGSLAQITFLEYQQLPIIIGSLDSGHVPGYALVNNIPYLELKNHHLLERAYSETQRHFYQAAGIKTAVFMGCNAGEIEIGFSEESQLVNIEMEMRRWFPDDFSRSSQLLPTTREQLLPHPTSDQNRPASSSSSLRSLSYESPPPEQYPPLPPPFLNIDPVPSDQINPQTQDRHQIPPMAALMRPSPSLFQTTTTTTNPHQQAIEVLSQIRSPQIPSIESEDDAMTKAILAVICSDPSNSPNSSKLPPKSSAFKWYGSGLAAAGTVPGRYRRQNMLKRSIALLRNLNAMRSCSATQEQQLQSSRSSSTQLHHMISERRRRERLNESFQALRSLLPPGTKKDKASVLSSTTEYLSSLITQVGELSRRNQILEAELLPEKSSSAAAAATVSSDQIRAVDHDEVRITQLSESTSTARLFDLHVITRRRRAGGENIISINMNLVIRLLELLKGDQTVNLLSIEANTTSIEESTSVNQIVFRLKIEGEWDESAFQEAVRRVVNDQDQ
ncbi:hypothetical protein M9H77_14724 [Catharanthus roseus]|uniref:Uncharacterized protein n=1 Tax=Catharanthus roseus TaxID=4058 RepID=A0ACC0BNV2_CATRO|nr:hypothetical protein M9H77_14724 [Catharanthus roseus]